MAVLGSTVINGNLAVSGEISASSLNLKSDEKLKENIVPFVSNPDILKLPVYKYDFINGPKGRIGCLAQDLQKICPEIVHIDELGDLAIEEQKIVYLLLEEIKKLTIKVNILENEIKALKDNK